MTPLSQRAFYKSGLEDNWNVRFYPSQFITVLLWDQLCEPVTVTDGCRLYNLWTCHYTIIWYFLSVISSNKQCSNETLVYTVIGTSDPFWIVPLPCTLPPIAWVTTCPTVPQGFFVGIYCHDKYIKYGTCLEPW
jgi:hypothetical protein